MNDKTTAAETAEQDEQKDLTYTVEFIFKSGASTTVEVAGFTITGTGYKWTHAAGDDKLLTIDPDEVAAVIRRAVA